MTDVSKFSTLRFFEWDDDPVVMLDDSTMLVGGVFGVDDTFDPNVMLGGTSTIEYSEEDFRERFPRGSRELEAAIAAHMRG